MREGVCNQICQYALSISEKVKKKTLFDAAYNSALNKFYHYFYDAEMIFDLAMALVNGATKEDELAEFDYKDEIEVNHQIVSHTYPTQKAQIQQLEQINIRLCEEYIMPCDKQWCPKCYALSIPLPIKDDQHEIKFGIQDKKVPVTLIYLAKNQSVITLKYFNNKRQGIKSEKAHKINAGYDLRYPKKDTLILQPKSLTRINLKITLEISPEMIVQIASRSSLASKRINIRGRIIDAGYTGDITVMLQNEIDKPFKIEHTEKIAQAIYLPLINISGLQLVNQREQLGKILNIQNESHQILRLPQPITILPFGKHHKIYTCRKLTTTQQIFEANEQICTKHGISIPNIYIPKEMKKKSELFIAKSFNKNYPKHSENYHIVIGKLSQINMEQLKPQQQNQLKELIAEHADIFAENNNDLGRTDLVQHQIYTEDAKPR
ncbi:hypothetical protein G9A89_003160 [Geosiphon pyriformis]|nr:hypothetical protein G9A89_003160 [Geosiphon pyriformis]